MTGGSIRTSNLFRVGVSFYYCAEGPPLGVCHRILRKGNRHYLPCGTVSIYRDAWLPHPAPLTMEYEL